MADEGDGVAKEISAQLDVLLGPVPEPEETQDPDTPVDDGAEERLTREFPARYGT